MISNFDQSGGPSDAAKGIVEALLMMCESLPHWKEFSPAEQASLTEQWGLLVKECPAEAMPMLRAISHLPAHWRRTVEEAML